MIRVLIADDQALVRGGFRLILDGHDDITVVGEAADGLEAVNLATRLQPDVTLMDIRMPELDGIQATRRLVANGATKVLILTTFDLDEYVYEAMRAGASGFLLKTVRPQQLAAAVRDVANGDALLAPAITRRLVEAFVHRPAPGSGVPIRLAELTPRELDVLRLVAQGLSNGEIAARLIVGESTAKTHVARIFMKLGLRDRVQAVVLAYESGLVQPGDTSPNPTAWQNPRRLATASRVSPVRTATPTPVPTTTEPAQLRRPSKAVLAEFPGSREEWQGSGGYYVGIAALFIGATCALFVVKPRLRSGHVQTRSKLQLHKPRSPSALECPRSRFAPSNAG